MNIKFISFGVLLCYLFGSVFSTAGCIEKDLMYESFESNGTNSLQNTYVVVDTGQNICYDNKNEISCPDVGESFYGQDAQYYGSQPFYQDNGDGTVMDLNTGLMWQQSPDMNGDGNIDYDDKMYYDDALAGASSFNLAGYNDWRLPSIKELYSLIMFYGVEPNPNAQEPGNAVPFIDTTYFDFGYGDLSAGERIIDAQYASSTIYVSTTMGGDKTMFGVNFADGRIKGYPAEGPMWKKYYVMYVRGSTAYGTNQFVDNGDGTITDSATGLMWMKSDNGAGVLWENALSYAEGFEYAGYTDWRLPNAKELQSIVDYTRSPATNNSAAIDPMFDCTQITNEAGEIDYPYYWTSTTHCSLSSNGAWAAYICFGRGMGYMFGQGGWIDVHGAGCQRSDPKTGDPDDYPYGHGPQGDAIRIYNYVRCVRGGLSDNQAPDIPETPDGPVSGKSGTKYTYSTSTCDPDGDQVYYWFDWGDDSNSGWLGPYDSGEECTAYHTWNLQGNYEIRVKAKDIYEYVSDWSEPLVVTMSRDKAIINSLLLWFLEQYPLLNRLLTLIIK